MSLIGITPPVDLYRWSKASSGPKMEIVRYPPGLPALYRTDVTLIAGPAGGGHVGLLVKGRLEGVSTYSAPNSSVRRGGKWHRIPAQHFGGPGVVHS